MTVNYENAKVYKIIGPNDFDPCYVGSTIRKYLSQRLTKHITHHNRFKVGKEKQRMMSSELFDKYGSDNCKIVLLEIVNAKSKEELRMKEQEYINKLDCVNKVKAYCSIEDKKESRRKWLDTNKDTLAAKKKAYAEANKEKFKLFQQNYQQENKEDIAIKKKAYAEAHKAERKVYSEKTYFCESCKCDVKLIRKSRHIKQVNHITNGKALEQN